MPPPAGQPRYLPQRSPCWPTPASTSTPPPAGQRRHLPLHLPLLANPDLPLRLPLLANPDLPLRLPLLANPHLPLRRPLLATPDLPLRLPLLANPHLPLRLPLLANAGIYLYASLCWPTPIYFYASPCWPTPIYLYASPCWFAATPIPYPQRLPLLAETTPASLLPQHQTAAPHCSPTPSRSRRAFPDVMASLDVQPHLTEARPDPDTPAQVTTGLTTAAWEHTLKESELAATRRANAKKVRDKDLVDYRKKREKYTYALLNAYNAAINMEARKREGRPTDLSRQEKTVLKGLSAPPHVEERAAPLTLDGADVEGKGAPCGEDNTYPSLEENPPFPNNTRAHHHTAAMTTRRLEIPRAPPSNSQYST
ncbi:unnamed protein product [Boreogadus saida]